MRIVSRNCYQAFQMRAVRPQKRSLLLNGFESANSNTDAHNANENEQNPPNRQSNQT
jgi:hypothetical protein